MCILCQLKVTSPNIHFKYDAIYCLTERSDSSNWVETVMQNEICRRKVSILAGSNQSRQGGGERFGLTWRGDLSRLKSTSAREKCASLVNSKRHLQIFILSTMQFIVLQKDQTLRTGSKLWCKMKSAGEKCRFWLGQINPVRGGGNDLGWLDAAIWAG